MLMISAATIQKWAKWWDEINPSAAVADYSEFKTMMTLNEKEEMDQIIAEAQMAEDKSAETTDAAIVTRCLIENRFHPAFEYNAVISGQAAFEQLKAAQLSSPKL